MKDNALGSMRQQASREPKHSHADADMDKTPNPQSEEQIRTASTPSVTTASGQEPKSGCPDCAALRAELEELRTSRDDALLALAKERELLEALRAKYSRAERYLRLAQDPPLRYMVVDKLNQALKVRFEILHVGAKKLTSFFLRSKG